MFQTFSFIFLIAALLSVINYRWLKLPATIGTMILALIVALLVILSEPIFPELYQFMCGMITEADFKTLLLDVMLSMLLFAGAIHINIAELEKEKWSVLLFATLGVLISTFVVGSLIYVVAPIFGIDLPYICALLFGALISPTDPIAVLAILKKTKISKSLELKIEGESLFNDGIGVVVFTSVMMVVSMGSGGESSILGAEIAHIFLKEVLGGLIFGFVLGWLTLKLMKSVEENCQLVVILTMAAVLGGYAIAHFIGTSGPLAMVVTGLMIGNGLNHNLFAAKTKEMTNEIWEILDESLNTVLFVLIGFSIHLIDLDWSVVGVGIAAIFIVLLGRIISIAASYSILNHKDHDFWKTSAVLTWGGLRGGISLALALSIPEAHYGNEIFLICFIVVLFSILVQGLSISLLVKKLL